LRAVGPPMLLTPRLVVVPVVSAGFCAPPAGLLNTTASISPMTFCWMY